MEPEEKQLTKLDSATSGESFVEEVVYVLKKAVGGFPTFRNKGLNAFLYIP